ncbi:hypothetical protein KRR40_30205 [Niabella defluvii]|nr:hypothetical protein KRR40_30205 [Niabella sp. I65]
MKKKTLGICIAVVSAFTGLLAVIAPKAEAKALGQCNLVVSFTSKDNLYRNRYM